MKIEITKELYPGQVLWKVKWGDKGALRASLVSALIRAWWRNRKYIKTGRMDKETVRKEYRDARVV